MRMASKYQRLLPSSYAGRHLLMLLSLSYIAFSSVSLAQPLEGQPANKVKPSSSKRLHPTPVYPQALKTGYQKLPSGDFAKFVKQKMIQWEAENPGKKFVNDHYTMQIRPEENSPKAAKIRRFRPAEPTFPTLEYINWDNVISGLYNYSTYKKVSKQEVSNCQKEMRSNSPFKPRACPKMGEVNPDTEKRSIMYLGDKMGYCGIQAGSFKSSVRPILAFPAPKLFLCGGAYREFMFDSYYSKTAGEFAQADYRYHAIKKHNASLPGIERDYKKRLGEIAALMKRAEAGDVNAQFRAGWLTNGGKDGITNNATQSIYWFKQAASQNHAESQYHLGISYAYGFSVPKDVATAKYLLSKAAAQGHQEANKLLQTINKFQQQQKQTGSNGKPGTQNTAAHQLGRVLGGLIILANSKPTPSVQAPDTPRDPAYVQCYNRAIKERIATCSVSLGDCDVVGCNYEASCNKGWDGWGCESSLSFKDEVGTYYCDIQDKWNYDEDARIVLHKICKK